MRKLLVVAIGLVALAVAGIALAKNSGSSVTSVAGTFTATTVSHSEQQSCTGAAGKTIQSTSATYTGTAAGDSSFAGDVTVHARSVIDTTADLGVVQGSIKVGGGEARFSAVYDHGKLAGLLTGHVGGKDAHSALLANVSAGFSAAGGFTGGKIGASDGGSAIELTAGDCTSPGDKGKGKHKDGGSSHE